MSIRARRTVAVWAVVVGLVLATGDLRAAIGTPVNITEWGFADTTNATSYTTASSFTPTDGRLYLFVVVNARTGGAADLPTISTTAGLTVVQIATEPFDTAGVKRVTAFRALVTSGATSGTVTVDFGGVTQQGCALAVSEWTGIDTSGSNGSGAIVSANTVQGESAAGSELTLNYAQAWASGSAGWSGLGLNVNSALNPDASWTELSDTGYSSPVARTGTGYALSEDSSVDFDSDSGSGTRIYAAIILEIKAEAGGGSTPRRLLSLTGAGREAR